MAFDTSEFQKCLISAKLPFHSEQGLSEMFLGVNSCFKYFCGLSLYSINTVFLLPLLQLIYFIVGPRTPFLLYRFPLKFPTGLCRRFHGEIQFYCHVLQSISNTFLNLLASFSHVSLLFVFIIQISNHNQSFVNS